MVLRRWTATVLLSLCFAHTLCALTPSEVEDILAVHNRAREDLGLPPLRWNEKLALVAQSYADQCHWAHNQDRTRAYQQLESSALNDWAYWINYGADKRGSGNRVSVGENIAAGSGGKWFGASSSPGELVQLWVNEKSSWSYPNHCQPGAVCGHYTQVIWRATKDVGCGFSHCDRLGNMQNGVFLVCDYTPAGNFVGQAPY